MTILRVLLLLSSVFLVLLQGGPARAQSEPKAESKKEEPQKEESTHATETPVVKLDDEAAFARARAYYEASEFDACVTAFGNLLNPESPERLTKLHLIEESRIYYAACLLAGGQTDRADEQMRMALRANPLMGAPDPLVFPDKVIVRFFAVREQLRREIEAAQEEQVRLLQAEAARKAAEKAGLRARIQELEKEVNEERVVHENSRWLAWVPLGVGQFQNQDDLLGWLFLTSETALAGAAIVSVSVQLSLNSQANGGNTSKDTLQINDRLRVAHGVELASLAGLVGVAALGIVEANLSFRPELDLGTRPRQTATNKKNKSKRSSKTRVAPTVTPVEGGLTLGVVGRF